MQNRPGIYKITNMANGLIYVGSAHSVLRRIKVHVRHLKSGRHENLRLQNSWNKYGESSFQFSVIEYLADNSLLLEREQFFIDVFSAAKKPNFNICPTAGNTAGRLTSDETKLKMSAAHMGKKNSKESTAKTAAAHTGMKRSPETRKRISDAATGRTMHPNTRAAIKLARVGSKHSQASIQKISDARIGVRLSEDTKKKISEKAKGRPSPTKGTRLSDEQKQHLSVIAKQNNYSARLAEAKRGKPMHPNTRAALAKAHIGRKHSEEAKAKISESQLRRRSVQK